MQPRYRLNGNTYVVTPLRRRDDILVEVDGHSLDARLRWLDSHRCELTINGVVRQVYVAQDDDRIFVHLDGISWQLDVLDEFSDTGASAVTQGSHIRAPMPGVVVEVTVAKGDRVQIGDTLMLMESMKLQTEIRAQVAGTVTELGCSAGESFNKGTLLVAIDVDVDVGTDVGTDVNTEGEAAA